MFPSPNSSSSLAPLPFLSDFNFHSSPNNFPLDFSSIFHQQPSSLNMDLQQPHNITTSMADDVTKLPKKQAAAPRKRTSKKDRHSKIYTAKGPRDRRMRLSLEVARKFFDLQDMLGFDKASGTVEWLLNQSESSIDQLKKTLIGKDCKLLATGQSSSSPSIASECDVACENIFDGSRNSIINSGLLSNYSRANIDVRESRKMARARAKERTKEKMKWTQSSNNNGSKAPAHQQSTVVEEPELGQSLLISYNMSMELADTRQQQQQQQQQQLGLGDHVVVSDDAIAGHTQQHLYTDLQLLTKPWEAFNNAPPTYLC